MANGEAPNRGWHIGNKAGSAQGRTAAPVTGLPAVALGATSGCNPHASRISTSIRRAASARWLGRFLVAGSSSATVCRTTAARGAGQPKPPEPAAATRGLRPASGRRRRAARGRRRHAPRPASRRSARSGRARRAARRRGGGCSPRPDAADAVRDPRPEHARPARSAPTRPRGRRRARRQPDPSRRRSPRRAPPGPRGAPWRGRSR